MKRNSKTRIKGKKDELHKTKQHKRMGKHIKRATKRGKKK